MKNREEYQASIFAKRDALLQKRKKRISQAAAGAGIAVIFSAAFAFIPKMPDRIPQSPVSSTALQTAEKEIYAESASFIPEEYITYISDFADRPYTKPTAAEDTALQMNEKEEAIMSAGETSTVENSKPEINNLTDASEETTKRKNFASVIDGLIQKETENYKPDSGGDDIIQYAPPADTGSDEEATENTDSSNKFPTEEIIAAAIGYLPDEYKKTADDANASVIPVAESSCSYYLVSFDTEKGKVQVKLNGQTLSHMETLVIPPKTIARNAETTTHREGYKGY